MGLHFPRGPVLRRTAIVVGTVLLAAGSQAIQDSAGSWVKANASFLSAVLLWRPLPYVFFAVGAIVLLAIILKPELITTGEPLAARGQKFYLAELARDGLIERRIFEDCQLYGPAVIRTIGVGTIHGNEWYNEGGPEAMLMEITQTTSTAGVIVIKDPFFRDCHFYNVGIVGTEAELERWRTDFNLPKKPATQPTVTA